MSQQKTPRRGSKPGAASEREKLRTLYRDYADWINVFNWVTDTRAIDRAILEMARINWDIQTTRNQLHRKERGR